MLLFWPGCAGVLLGAADTVRTDNVWIGVAIAGWSALVAVIGAWILVRVEQEEEQREKEGAEQ